MAYSYTVDLQNLNTSHSLAVLSVPPGSRVLDLGTADGSVARALLARQCTVWGLEVDPVAAEAARAVCERVIVADLEASSAWDGLAGQTFDVVLALDVLEHLSDPLTVLRRAMAFVAPSGVVIISVPNVTHAAVRLSLLSGHFDYTEQGLLDRTHLRFFDRRSAERLLGDAGLTIVEHLRVTRDVDQTEIPVRREDIDPAVLSSLAGDPDSATYQFIFVARPSATQRQPASASLSERLLEELEALQARFAEVERYAKSLEAEGARTAGAVQELAELREELARRVQEAHQHRLELTHSKADILVKQRFADELRAALQVSGGSPGDVAGLRAQLQARAEAAAAQQQAWAEERQQLLARIDDLQRYANSAGFRLVNSIIVRSRHLPFIHAPARALVRALVRMRDGAR